MASPNVPPDDTGWRGRLKRPVLGVEMRHHAVRLAGSGATIHYRACGPRDGQPIVLIHGVGITADYYEALMRGLAACGLRAIAPDMPGFGGTALTADRRRSTCLADLTDLLAEWIAQDIDGPAHILGHSGGCQQAGDLAVRYPALVNRLILASVAPGGSMAGMIRSTLGFAVEFFLESPEIIFLALKKYLVEAGVARMVEMMLAYADDDLDVRLPCITQPTLLVWGDRDPIAPIAYADRALARLPTAHIVVVPHSPHCVIYQTWRETCAAIVAFLGLPLAPGILPECPPAPLAPFATIAARTLP